MSDVANLMIDDLIDKLLAAGSVHKLAQQVGDQQAATALHELTDRCPQEISGSWPLVITWGRLQAAHDTAFKLGDLAMVLKIAQAQASLIKDLH